MLRLIPAGVRRHPRGFALAAFSAAWAAAGVLTAGLALGVSIGFDDESEVTTYQVVLGGLAFDGEPPSAADLALAAAASTGPEAPGNIVLQSPLQDWTSVTDRFAAPRPNDRLHSGIDFGLATLPASPVHAACAGVVTVAGEDPGYGLFVVVSCGEGWSVLTAHLSEILVEEGQIVRLGKQIGISGSTGYSTGEHLHFEIRKYGVSYNPELYIDFGVPPDAPLSSDEPLEPLEPSPEDEPQAGESPTAETTDTPSPDPTATCTPTPTLTPTPKQDSDTGPAGTGTPTPTLTGTPTPAGTPTPTPSVSPSPSPSPTPTPDGWLATPPRNTPTPTPEPCG